MNFLIRLTIATVTVCMCTALYRIAGKPICISEWNCTVGHLYCGHKLKDIVSFSTKLANSLQLNDVYECNKESDKIWPAHTCYGECVQLDEGKICCNQPCKINSTYCGEELNNLKCLIKFPSNERHHSSTVRKLYGVHYCYNYTANNLYRCKGSQQVELLENCSHTCTASKTDSYCDESTNVCGSVLQFSYGYDGKRKTDGILITSEWALTSASAHPGIFGIHNIITVGTDYSRYGIQKGDIDVKIAAVVEYPEYIRYSKGTNDLALVRLKSPVTALRPVCLTNATASDFAECILTGWGTRHEDPNAPIRKLQHVKVKMFTKEICYELLRNDSHELLTLNNLIAYQNLTEEHICGYAIDRPIQCKGETGMLMCRNDKFASWMATGMLIEGPKHDCEDKRRPLLLFADLSYYCPWIVNVTGIDIA